MTVELIRCVPYTDLVRLCFPMHTQTPRAARTITTRQTATPYVTCFLHQCQRIVVLVHLSHKAVLNVEYNVPLVTVISNERMKRVALRNPAHLRKYA
jgi:hypothetical protein